jgi:hypothetical protein
MAEQRTVVSHREKVRDASEVASGSTNAFPMTDWGLVMSDGSDSRAALERLYRAYWRPAYTLVRRGGYARDEALELIREFFAESVERNALWRVKAGSQPFRVWLLNELEAFLVGRTPGTLGAAAVRGKPLELVEAEEADALDRMADGALEPRREYERVLALGILERAVARLERAQADLGQSERFQAFKAWLVVEPSQEELSSIAKALGLGPASARMARHAIRQRLGAFVHQEISNLLEKRDDTQGLRTEMVALLGALESSM